MRKYERAYVTLVGDMVLVHYRPTHEYLGGFDTVPPAVKFLKDMMRKSQVDFLKWMKDTGKRLPRKVDFDDSKANPFKENDEWFEKAWKGQTDKFFSKHGITQVLDELDFKMIEQEVIGGKTEKRKVPHAVEPPKVHKKVVPPKEEEPEELDLDLSFLEGLLHVDKEEQNKKPRRKVVRK